MKAFLNVALSFTAAILLIGVIRAKDEYAAEGLAEAFTTIVVVGVCMNMFT